MPVQRRVSDLWLAAHQINAGLQAMVIEHGHSGGRGARRQARLATRSLCWLFAAVAISCALVTPRSMAHDDAKSRVFGFLPIVSTERLARRFGPLVDYLSNELGVDVVLETAPSFAEFMRRTQDEQRYDYLFTAPHFYFLAQRRAGYRVMVRADGEPLRSAIVVRNDSGITDISELCGKTVATPSTMALTTTLIRQRLIRAGCDVGGSTTLVPTPSHNSAMMSVFRGATEGAGFGTVPLRLAEAGIRAELRVVAETDSTPNMPFSVAPWIDEDEAARFRDALTRLSESAEGAELLEHLGWTGFVVVGPEEYDMMEEYLPTADES